MSLLEIWKENPDQISEKRVDQIIGFAGDGKLGDNKSAPAEFRAFLEKVPADILEKYANDCLVNTFADSGLALQDIVNEIARRLGFDVQHGRYRGTQNAIGYDGIWTDPQGHDVIAEVKTTDAYRISLETVAGYRNDLAGDGRISEDSSSILIIVGREDTGDLEAQIRGSRHAWDVRLISVDALIRLMKTRLELEAPGVAAQCRSLLVPREHTKLDDIIKLVFSTTEDVLNEESPEMDEDERSEASEDTESEKVKPMSFNDACAARVGKHLGADLTKQSRSIYADSDLGIALTCSVSKEYVKQDFTGYWFAFHQHQLETLREAKNGFAAFGCGSPAQIAVFPLEFFETQLGALNQSHRERHDGKIYSYWHLIIHRYPDGKWVLMTRAGEERPDISDKTVLEDGD